MTTGFVILSCGLLIAAGALVQGVIGLGMALVASPVIVLLDPTLVPGALIVTSVALPVMTLMREHHDIDWRGLRWALPWRFAGTAIGAWLVVIASARWLGVLVGVFVLCAVALSLVRWKPSPTPLALSIGAFVSGVGGTATSIGGPPMALVYQNQRPSMLRCTMAVYFLVAGAVSLASLAAVGELSARQVTVGLWLIPFVFAGFAASQWLRTRVDARRVRAAVLVLSAVSSVGLIVRGVIGG